MFSTEVYGFNSCKFVPITMADKTFADLCSIRLYALKATERVLLYNLFYSSTVLAVGMLFMVCPKRAKNKSLLEWLPLYLYIDADLQYAGAAEAPNSCEETTHWLNDDTIKSPSNSPLSHQ